MVCSESILATINFHQYVQPLKNLPTHYKKESIKNYLLLRNCNMFITCDCLTTEQVNCDGTQKHRK
jgi:hypothetical protein